MTLTILVTLFIISGVPAILYLVLALLRLRNHARHRKILAGIDYHGSAPLSARAAAVSEAFWGRTKILLQNGRFDAALADCKQALKINPDHPEAKRLWDYFARGTQFQIPGGENVTSCRRRRKNRARDGE